MHNRKSIGAYMHGLLPYKLHNENSNRMLSDAGTQCICQESHQLFKLVGLQPFHSIVQDTTSEDTYVQNYRTR